MKKFDFPLIADVLFYTLAAWFVLVGVLRAAHVAGGVCFAAATLIALAFGGVLLFAFSLRRRRRALGKAEREEREKLMLHLALETDERVRAALLAALCADGKDAHCEGDALAADGTVVVPVFTMQPLSADTVARLLKTYKERPFLLACNALSPEAEGLLRAFGRSAMRGEEVYELFRRTDTMPAPLICGELPRRSAKKALKRAFSRRNAYPFFVSGAGLLLMSLYVFFPVYYLVAGSLLLFAAVLIRTFGREA